MGMSLDDIQSCVGIVRALHKDVDAGNLTISSTYPNLNACGFITAATLKTLVNRIGADNQETFSANRPSCPMSPRDWKAH